MVCWSPRKDDPSKFHPSQEETGRREGQKYRSEEGRTGKVDADKC